MSNPYEIVILGNNFAGLTTAHYLLKQTIPQLKALKSDQAYHVTLVGPSEYAYYKICAPRILAAPDLIALDQAAFPVKDLVAGYAKDEFTWIQGLATGVDEKAKQVTVTVAGDPSPRTLSYGSLVIATGSTLDPLWAANDDFSATRSSFDAMHKALPSAKTVLIAGGGPVGVETAGELITKYPQLKLKLLSGTDRVLSMLSTSTSAKAEKMLKSKGIEVINNKKVTSPTSSSATSTTVQFDDGTSETVDVYIHAVGGRVNTAFLPAEWLNERKKVKVDYDTCRGPVPDVYAFGDAADNTQSTFMDLQFQTGPCMSAISQDLASKIEAKNQTSGPFKERKFKPLKDSQFVPIGKSGGVGQVFGWGLPSFFVWLVKARTFFLEKAKSTFDGSSQAKA